MYYSKIRFGLASLLMLLIIPISSIAGERDKSKPCCTGLTYSVTICSGDSICLAEDGEYDFPYEKCSNPIKVTAININDFAGNLRLLDPPCADPKKCKRISVLDSSGIPEANTACRFREKVAVCKPK